MDFGTEEIALRADGADVALPVEPIIALTRLHVMTIEATMRRVRAER